MALGDPSCGTWRDGLCCPLHEPGGDPLPPGGRSRLPRASAIVRELYDVAVEALVATKRREFCGCISARPTRSSARGQHAGAVRRLLRAPARARRRTCRRVPVRRIRALLRDGHDGARRRLLRGRSRAIWRSCGSDAACCQRRLGEGNKGIGYVLRRHRELSWWERLARTRQTRATASAPDRDEAGSSPGRPAQRGSQPGRQRAGAVEPTTSAASSRCCGRSWLLRRLP